MYKAINVEAEEKYKIKVMFSDGKVVLYDVEPFFDMIPAFRTLQSDPALFRSVKLGADGKVIWWNDHVNLNAETVWANGILIEYVKVPDIRHLLAYYIKTARINLGMTQKELSVKTGICQADISKMERGLGNPSVSTLERLAQGLQLDLVIRMDAEENTKKRPESGGKSMEQKESAAVEFVHKTLEERAAEYHGQLNLDGEYDWGEPVGREVW